MIMSKSDTNQNHHVTHHFIDGIGDGNHQEYDLPNFIEQSHHAFIRKRGIEELKSSIQNSHHHSHRHNQHQTRQQRDKGYHEQQSQDGISDDGKSSSASSSSLHKLNTPLHQQQPHLPPDPIVRYVTNNNGNSNQPQPPPLTSYEIKSDHTLFLSSSSSFVFILIIISVLIALNYLSSFFFGKHHSASNIQYFYKKKSLSSTPLASSLSPTLISSKDKSLSTKPTLNFMISQKMSFRRIKAKLFYNQGRSDNEKTRKKTDECSPDDEEDSSSLYNESNNIDGYYSYQQDTTTTTRLRKPIIISSTNTTAPVVTDEKDDEIEFGVGLDGFEAALYQSNQRRIPKANHIGNMQQYGGGSGVVGSIDYKRDASSTSSHGTSSEDDEWDQISTRSTQSNDISLSSLSSKSSYYHNDNNKCRMESSPIESPSQANHKKVYLQSPIYDTKSFFDSPSCSINDDNTDDDGESTASTDLPLPEDEEMPTPRIDNYDAKPKRLFTPSATSYSSYQIPTLPTLDSNVIANDYEKAATSTDVGSNLPTDDNDPFAATKSPAPRSVSVDELKLISMETGMVNTGLQKWESKVDPQDSKSTSQALSSPEQCDINFCRNVKLQEASKFNYCESKRNVDNDDDDDDDDEKYFSGETEGANGILHKRKNLTSCSDSASSLTSPIAFTELKMKELIGSGGFGQVWSATWRGTPVAVKVLAVSHKAEHIQKAIIQEFAAEINMVSGMRHPNICLYIGACLEPSNRAIVTELASNGSLWDALRQPLRPPHIVADGKTRNAWPLSLYHSVVPTNNFDININVTTTPEFIGTPVPFGTSPYVPLAPAGSWPWYLVHKIAEGAARGMNYLHCGNPPVLHRDLKSANILLDDSYNAKVADFGLSRLKAQERSMTGNCGTVFWMAPEILANESYAEPADVYSFGIILWELLVKECPYGDMTPIQCALAVLNQDKRPEIPEWCPPGFRNLISHCMEKDPTKRPTFAEVIAILDNLR